MKTVIKAVFVTLAVFACILGMSYIGDLLQKPTGGLSHWLILGGCVGLRLLVVLPRL